VNRKALRRHDKWVGGLRRVENEGQGVWDLRVFFPEHFIGLMADARSGNPNAAVVLDLLANTIGHVGRADPPALCLLCDHEFKGDTPAAFVIVTARVDAPKQGIGNALCDGCIEPGETLLERVAQSYKERVMGDLRILQTPSAPGRA
jgi:hypothetical protein